MHDTVKKNNGCQCHYHWINLISGHIWLLTYKNLHSPFIMEFQIKDLRPSGPTSFLFVTIIILIGL